MKETIFSRNRGSANPIGIPLEGTRTLSDPMLEQRPGRTRKQLAHQINATATNVHSG